MRVVFMGTPAFAAATLDALHERGDDIALVFTQPDRPVGRCPTHLAANGKVRIVP